MYLTEIDPKTGLLKIDDAYDGVLAISDFKKVIDMHGLACMTCVALTVDYLTPIRYYAYKERHIKAMRDTTGKSDAFDWGLDEIQLACKKYKELEFHPDIEEMELLKEMRLAKIKEVEAAENDEDKQEKFKELAKIRNLQEEFSKKLDMNEIIGGSPTINGYSLSRLEQKITNKNSFYHGKQKNESGASS